MTVRFPERFMSDEVRELFKDCFRFDSLEEVDHYIDKEGNHLELQIDDSSSFEDVALELNGIGVPAVVYQGGSYEYDPAYYLSYPKGDPTYPNGEVVTIPCNNDSIPVMAIEDICTELSTILNNLDVDNMILDLKDYRNRMEKMNLFANNIVEKLLGYYEHETDIGRNPDISMKIDNVLKRLDNGEIENAEAMKLIREIRRGD